MRGPRKGGSYTRTKDGLVANPPKKVEPVTGAKMRPHSESDGPPAASKGS